MRKAILVAASMLLVTSCAGVGGQRPDGEPIISNSLGCPALGALFAIQETRFATATPTRRALIAATMARITQRMKERGCISEESTVAE